jgi:hypothetical protein
MLNILRSVWPSSLSYQMAGPKRAIEKGYFRIS